jgi:TolB protein
MNPTMRNGIRIRLRPLFWLAVLACPTAAQAVLQIEITRGVEAGIPIAVVPFAASGPVPQPIADIIEADLKRSGRFDPVARRDFLSQPSDHSQVNFSDWRLIKSEALVVGRVTPAGGDRYDVQFQLFDVFKGTQLAGFRYQETGPNLRRLAHRIADIIYEKLIGEPGAFDTRIAYVTVEGPRNAKPRFLLQIADSDGYGPVTVLESREPILSPAWAPDGSRLAYVSFENRRPVVFIQRLQDGTRTKIADHPGVNSAPAFSPDGRQLALTLSKDGNPEIYVMDLAGGGLRRLTNHHAIDTEPAWSPDGRYLVFTSDRAGRPQIYRMGAGGGEPERVTFEGSYNARASYSADGKRLVLVTNQGSGYQIGVLYLANRALHVLTGQALDESPSFAPNGAMVLYAGQENGRGVLAAVSADGRVRNTMRFAAGDVREPAWSPLNR